MLRKTYREDKLPIIDANAITMTMNASRTRIGATRLCGLRDSNDPSRGASKSGSISTPMVDIRRGGGSQSSFSSPPVIPTKYIAQQNQTSFSHTLARSQQQIQQFPRSQFPVTLINHGTPKIIQLCQYLGLQSCITKGAWHRQSQRRLELL